MITYIVRIPITIQQAGDDTSPPGDLVSGGLDFRVTLPEDARVGDIESAFAAQLSAALSIGSVMMRGPVTDARAGVVHDHAEDIP